MTVAHNLPNPSHLASVISFFQLSAALSLVDGPLNALEIDCFSSFFPFANLLEENLKSLFIEACKAKNDYEIAAAKIYSLLPNQIPIYKRTVQFMLRLAIADGYLKNSEMRMIKKLIEIFELSVTELPIYLEQQLDVSSLLKDYRKLPTDLLHQQYRKLIKLYHPDAYNHLPDIAGEYLEVILAQFRKINAVYEKFRSKRLLS